MQARRLTVPRSFAFGAGGALQAQQLPMEPVHDSGQSVTGAFEGWFQNQDGTYSLLVGYFNRNVKEELDIPVGPNNRIDPGGPDQGQPTHFLPRRQWGVFTVTVPKDFGSTKAHLDARRQRQDHANSPRFESAVGDFAFFRGRHGKHPAHPPFREKPGRSIAGPRPLTKSLTATVGNPLPLNVWVADDAKTFPGAKPPNLPTVAVTWSKFRGPGNVTFAAAKPAVEKDDSKATPGHPFAGKAATTATFSEPGDYVLLVVLNDWSGEGGRGFLCCWTNGMVKVSVKPR